MAIIAIEMGRSIVIDVATDTILKTGTTRANFHSSGKTPGEEFSNGSRCKAPITGAAIFNNLLEMLPRPVAFLSESLRNSSKTLVGQMGLY